MRVFERDGEIKTADRKMNLILATARKIAQSQATVLLTGESGTGKELLARLIHQQSPRRQKRFVAINCAAVPENLLESELFGYEKGAFTGANNTKLGRFELAHEGTLLLDEVSEMPLLLQAKLLRVLQEGEFEKLGSHQTQRVNVRVIATTNRDLKKMVAQKLFREDLFYRLHVVPLTLPPLRERKGDIELLAENFIERCCVRNGIPIKTLSASAMTQLLEYSWPGNIRELENLIERSVLLSEQSTLGPEQLQLPKDAASNETHSGDVCRLSVGTTVAEAERQLILLTLAHTGQNRAQAARILDISIRTLRNKLHEYGLMSASSDLEIEQRSSHVRSL